ncbi:MAG TPA: SDR family oxidoreductase [Blastocatellia bacterium]|nr:SDR family oxidoreductase [Blastocatellia bacterium]
MGNRLYLVTGGAGFIGSHICERLVRDGHRVRVLDNFASGREENLASIASDVDLIRGDIRDASAVREAMNGVEVVFHEAALGSVPRSVIDPVSTHETNATGTLNVLLAARDAGVRRVVYAASSSAYGDTPTLPKHEGMTPQPLSPYAVAKLVGEHYVSVFHTVYGFEAVSLRYFNIFGPRQDPESQYAAVIPKFVTAMLAGRRPAIYGDGIHSRDFTHVENVVEANLLAADAEGVAGRVFNIACGGRYTLLELVGKLNTIIGTTIDPTHEPSKPGDIRDSQASIDAAEHALGYRVTVRFDEGLRRTVASYRPPAV